VVCEDVGRNCAGGEGVNPMDPYTFTPAWIKNYGSATAAAETRAAASIAAAPKLGVGHFEAGGANPADYWKISLAGGDRVRFTATTPANTFYTFALYKPGTSDASFPNAVPVSWGETNDEGSAAQSLVTLQAPRSGTYVLVACEDVGENCASAVFGDGTDPMDPYTFTLKQIGGLETKTSLALSAASVVYGHEKSLKFSVSVKAVYGGSVTGKVGISDGKKTICIVKLVKGKGSCTVPASTTVPVGKYGITAHYAGNKTASVSGTVTLTVKK